MALSLEALLFLLFKGEGWPLVGAAGVVPGLEGSAGPGPGPGAKAKDLRAREKVLTCYCQLQAQMLDFGPSSYDHSHRDNGQLLS